MAMLRQRFANLQELVGHSLYVTVTVLTESGVRGDVGTGTEGRVWLRVTVFNALGWFGDTYWGHRGSWVGTCGSGWGQQGQGGMGTR